MADQPIEDNIFTAVATFGDDDDEEPRKSRFQEYLADDAEVKPRVAEKAEKPADKPHKKDEEPQKEPKKKGYKTILEVFGYSDEYYNNFKTQTDIDEAYQELTLFRERFEGARPDLFHPKTGRERAPAVNKATIAGIKKLKSIVLQYDRVIRNERLERTVKLIFQKGAGATEYLVTSMGVNMTGLTEELMTSKEINEDLMLISEDYLEYLSSSPQKRLMQNALLIAMGVYNRNLENAKTKKTVSIDANTAELLKVAAPQVTTPAPQVQPIIAPHAQIQEPPTEVKTYSVKHGKIDPDEPEVNAGDIRVIAAINQFKIDHPKFTDEKKITEMAIIAVKKQIRQAEDAD